MKKSMVLFLMLIMCLGACATPKAAQKDGVLMVNFKCDSERVFRVDYLAFTDGEQLCMGGIADYDKKTLKGKDDMAVPFGKEDLTADDGASKELSLELHI